VYKKDGCELIILFEKELKEAADWNLWRQQNG